VLDRVRVAHPFPLRTAEPPWEDTVGRRLVELRRLTDEEHERLYESTRSVLLHWTQASNETDYCPRCQTGGKLLADRVLLRLLKRDLPRTPEEFEEMRDPNARRG
jgi:hypothetical protein